MEILNLTAGVSKEDFWFNVCHLKDKSNIAFPLDFLCYRCECDQEITLCKNGEYFLDAPVSNLVERILEDKIVLHRKHLDETKCRSTQTLKINEQIGMPENLVVFMDESNSNDVLPFEIEKTIYEPILAAVTSDGAVLSLYRNRSSDDTTYLDFFKHNFENHLNQKEEEETNECEAEKVENLVSDDESVSQNQDLLPRLSGGGRKLLQDFRYVCQWCSAEVLQQKNRGRFRELKNYRDHFRKVHSDVPMREFLSKVQSNEPKWFCKICRRKISLQNQVRHQTICRPMVNDDSSSSSENEEQTIPQSLPTSSRSIPHPIPSSSKSAGTQTAQDCDSDSEPTPPHKQINKRQINSSEESDDEQPKNLSLSKQNKKKVIYASTSAPLNLSSVPKVSLSTPADNDKDYDVYDFDLELEEETIMSEVDPPVSTSSVTDRNIDDTSNPILTLVAENENVTPQVSKEDTEDKNQFFKWWQCESKVKYSTRDRVALPILEENDGEEFVKIVKENLDKHTNKKMELDVQMQQLETSEEKLNQFSEERDLPVINAFKEFVQQGSTKDILGYLSTEPDSDTVLKAARSSTSKQYSYRIKEFFNFMAKQYKGFHLDWLFDYKSEIEKVQPDGSVTNEIFVPPQDVLKNFGKSYLYGSNPAANAGMRVFGLKKLLEMMGKKVKENEHLFPGTINEKSSIVESLVKRLKHLEEEVCPSGTIKHISIASNKNHRKILSEKLKKCPEKSIERIMKGVSDYLNSDPYAEQKRSLFELAYVTTRIPTSRDYSSLTNWLLEVLVCIGGNRPCSILGITIKDWEERKAGFCPFNQSEKNELIVEDPTDDNRKVLANPFEKPTDSDSEEPTGVIVKTDSDKITVGPPCYIWIPNELEELVNAHSLMASKYLPRNVDIYHPETLLFLNSQGNQIKSIECKHFKDFIGLPIVAYDFRKSLSTFCLESKDEIIRNSEASVLRHSTETAYAYYYQKHGEKVEYVNIRYAVKHGLVRASVEDVDNQLDKMREKGLNDEWELSQKRNDRAHAFSQEVLQKTKEKQNEAQQKGGRVWVLQREYDDFLGGIMAAISLEEERIKSGLEAGPFSHLLKYKPGAEEAGVFPPNSVWWKDMCRVLFGLQGPVGDAMRNAELTVYNGIPFAPMSGRKKIQQEKSKAKGYLEEYIVIGQYWRNRIREEANKATKGKWNDIRFIFNSADLAYFKSLNPIS